MATMDIRPNRIRLIRRERDRFGFIVDRRKFSRFRVDGAQAFFEYDGSYMAAFILQQLLRAPAGVNFNVLFLRLGNLVFRSGHGIARFQTDHRDSLRTEAHRSAGAVNCDITAADDNDAAVHMLVLVGQRLMQEVNGDVGAGGMFARDARKPSALTADGDVECEEALFTQLRDGHIPADLHAAADLHAKFTQNLNFRVYDGFLQLE